MMARGRLSAVSIALWMLLALFPAPAAAAAGLVVLNAQGVPSTFYCGQYTIRGTGFPANTGGTIELYENGGLVNKLTVQTDATGTFSYLTDTGPLIAAYKANALPRFTGVTVSSATFYMACTAPSLSFVQQGTVTNQVCGNMTIRGQNFPDFGTPKLQIKVTATGEILWAPLSIVTGKAGLWQLDWTTPTGLVTSDDTVLVVDAQGTVLASAPLFIRCGSAATPTRSPAPTLTSPRPTATASAPRQSASAATATQTPVTVASAPASSSPLAVAASSPSPANVVSTLVDAASAVATNAPAFAAVAILAVLGLVVVRLLLRRSS